MITAAAKCHINNPPTYLQSEHHFHMPYQSLSITMKQGIDRYHFNEKKNPDATFCPW